MSIYITSSGIVEYKGERDGQTWRTTITPGDTAQATALLSAEELAQVQAAWTPAVVAAWQAQQAAEQAQAARQPNMGRAMRQGSGEGVIVLTNAQVTPTTNLAGGVILYAKDGKLMCRGGNGTITILAED